MPAPRRFTGSRMPGTWHNENLDYFDALIAASPLTTVNVTGALTMNRAAHANRTIKHLAADPTARTVVLPTDAVADDWISFVVQHGSGALTIQTGGSDVLRLAPTGVTGSRVLSANGMATAIKLGATDWLISGDGLI